MFFLNKVSETAKIEIKWKHKKKNWIHQLRHKFWGFYNCTRYNTCIYKLKRKKKHYFTKTLPNKDLSLTRQIYYCLSKSTDQYKHVVILYVAIALNLNTNWKLESCKFTKAYKFTYEQYQHTKLLSIVLTGFSVAMSYALMMKSSCNKTYPIFNQLLYLKGAN